MNEWKYTGAVYLKDGMLLSNGFVRIVHGDRGDYVEIHSDQMCIDVLHIPDDELWRVNSVMAYYVEYRTTGSGGFKVYLQKRPVEYAGYIVDMYYISPMFLVGFVIRRER